VIDSYSITLFSLEEETRSWSIDQPCCCYIGIASFGQVEIAKLHLLSCLLSLKNWCFITIDQDTIDSHLICIFQELLNLFIDWWLFNSRKVKQLLICQRLLSSWGHIVPTWFVVVQSQEGQTASHLSERAVFLGRDIVPVSFNHETHCEHVLG